MSGTRGRLFDEKSMSEIDKHISTSILDIEGLRNDLRVMCLLTKLRETQS